jgi:hypothetical protein
MTEGDQARSLSRDLNGAFGDLAWALGISPGPGGPPPPMYALMPLDESEMARQRLLLSGYTPEGSADKRQQWRSPDGEAVVLVELDAIWVRDALVTANRNRDSLGTPRLTAVFELVMRMALNPGDNRDIEGYVASLDVETVSAAQAIVAGAGQAAVAPAADSRDVDVD